MSSTPHESNELRIVTVLVDGQPVTSGVEVCITTLQVRPVEGGWAAATVRDGKTLVRVAGLTSDIYRVWARVTRGDEVAVIDLGPLSLS